MRLRSHFGRSPTDDCVPWPWRLRPWLRLPLLRSPALVGPEQLKGDLRLVQRCMPDDQAAVASEVIEHPDSEQPDPRLLDRRLLLDDPCRQLLASRPPIAWGRRSSRVTLSHHCGVIVKIRSSHGPRRRRFVWSSDAIGDHPPIRACYVADTSDASAFVPGVVDGSLELSGRTWPSESGSRGRSERHAQSWGNRRARLDVGLAGRRIGGFLAFPARSSPRIRRISAIRLPVDLVPQRRVNPYRRRGPSSSSCPSPCSPGSTW